MGYTVPVRTREFEFKDGDLKGLVVQFRANLSLDDYFDLVDAGAAIGKAKGLRAIHRELRKAAKIGFVGWNLENGAGPIEATPENFTRHFQAIDGMHLVTRYLAEVSGLPDPLATRSANGKRSARRPASSSRKS